MTMTIFQTSSERYVLLLTDLCSTLQPVTRLNRNLCISPGIHGLFQGILRSLKDFIRSHKSKRPSRRIQIFTEYVLILVISAILCRSHFSLQLPQIYTTLFAIILWNWSQQW
jgi:hypothetical protein